MRIKLTSFCMLILLFGISTSTQATILFQDDFASGSLANWNLTGSWSLVEQELHGAGSRTVGNAYAKYAFINGINTPDVFTLEADVLTSEVRSTDFGHVGFVWGYQDNQNYTNSYLRTHTDQVTTWNRTSSGTSSEYILQLDTSPAPGALTNSVFYHLKLSVDTVNKIMTAELDGISTTFYDMPMATGGLIGLMGYGNNVKFDNVKLSVPGPSPAPEPSTTLLIGIGLMGLAGVGRDRN